MLGDAEAIRLVSDDGRWIESVAFHNADPERYVLLGTILRAAVQRVDQGFAASVLATGEVLHMPHVRQDRARAIVLPEYHQFLDEVGVHSLLAVPISDAGSTVPTSQAAIAPGVIGVLYASRDTPGRPYGDDDFVECDRTVTRRDGRDVHVVVHRTIARAPDATPHCVVDVVREEVEMGPVRPLYA